MSKTRYEDREGRTVLLETSWESDGSGMIPPPVIEFYDNDRQPHSFVYQGLAA